MSLTKKEVEAKMKERGFDVFATMPPNGIHFMSAHLYSDSVPDRKRMPVINIIVDIEKEEFECLYCIQGSLTRLATPICGSLMNDEHFDRIVCKFESEAYWMSRLAE